MRSVWNRKKSWMVLRLHFSFYLTEQFRKRRRIRLPGMYLAPVSTCGCLNPLCNPMRVARIGIRYNQWTVCYDDRLILKDFFPHHFHRPVCESKLNPFLPFQRTCICRSHRRFSDTHRWASQIAPVSVCGSRFCQPRSARFPQRRWRRWCK